MRRPSHLTFALLALTAACQAPSVTTMSTAQRREIRDSVLAANNRLWAAIPSRNVDSILAFFSADVVFADVGIVFPTKDSLAAASRPMLATARTITVTSAEPRMVVLGNESASLTTTFRESITDTAGATTVYTGAWTAVYLHQRGRWMIVQAHESQPIPEPQAPAHPPRRRP